MFLLNPITLRVDMLNLENIYYISLYFSNYRDYCANNNGLLCTQAI